MAQYGDWDTYILTKYREENIPLAVEQAIAQKYSIEWHETSYAADDMEINQHENNLIIQSSNQDRELPLPFKTLLKKLGARLYVDDRNEDMRFSSLLLNFSFQSADESFAKKFFQFMTQPASQPENLPAFFKIITHRDVKRISPLQVMCTGVQLGDYNFEDSLYQNLTTLIDWLKANGCTHIEYLFEEEVFSSRLDDDIE